VRAEGKGMREKKKEWNERFKQREQPNEKNEIANQIEIGVRQYER
jgi:hypothetical protein